MKFKNILSGLLSLSAVLPSALICSNCANQGGLFINEAKQFRQECVEEFKGICTCPHPTFGTRQICDYMKSILKGLGYSEVNNLEDLKDNLSFYEDDYRATAFGIEKSSGNLLFNIHATPGREQSTPITLQAHMDMVLDGIPAGQELTTPIEPDIEDNLLHSKDYKTSLGADDGAGVAIILALAKNPNIVAHGPIRCIVTADEEDGDSGAANVSYLGLKNDYVLNLDGDVIDQIFISAAGVDDNCIRLLKFKEDFIKEIDLSATREYTISISGLLGGHSAININSNRANAITLLADLINEIRIADLVPEQFSLISLLAKDKNNIITQEASATFASTLKLEGDTYSEYGIKDIIKIKQDEYLKQYPTETGLKIEIKENTDRTNTGLTFDGSGNILEFVSKCLCGPIDWVDDERKEVQTSNNVSNLSLDLKATGDENHPQFQIENLTRSAVEQSFYTIKKYHNQLCTNYLSKMNNDSSTPLIYNIASNPAWEISEDKQYRDFTIEAFKNAKIDAKLINVHGWLELGAFWQKYKAEGKKPHMISIGPTITDCHNQMETLDLDSYLNEIQVTLYILNKLDTLNN